MRTIPYPHPGEILKEEFLDPMHLSAYHLAKSIGVQQTRISEIIAGTRSITVETGLLLSRFFGMSDEFWAKLQLDYDAAKARDQMAARLDRVEPYAAHA